MTGSSITLVNVSLTAVKFIGLLRLRNQLEAMDLKE
jgi:hypothetical protein